MKVRLREGKKTKNRKQKLNQNDLSFVTARNLRQDVNNRTKNQKSIYIKISCLSVDGWMCGWMCQVTSPEKTGLGDVKTEKTKKRQKLQKKLKTNKKNKKAKKLKKL